MLKSQKPQNTTQKAEELYQAGYLSYPRTETDVFDPGMDLLVGGLLCLSLMC